MSGNNVKNKWFVFAFYMVWYWLILMTYKREHSAKFINNTLDTGTQQ